MTESDSNKACAAICAVQPSERMSFVRRKTEAPDVLPAVDLQAGEARPRVNHKRRFGIFLLVLFVLAGTSAILYLTLFWIPSQYRQQAARLLAPTIRAAEIGDVVYLGAYEQDNDLTNGTEPIEWVVLDKMAGRLLLMSRYGLDRIPFNTAEAFVTWDQSSVLTWLNNTFYYSAFTGAERAMLMTSVQPTDTNPYFDTDPGEATTERLFLANIAEVAKYLPMEEDRLCQATPYAIERGAVIDKATDNCLWWLRSPGFDASAATRVLMDGRINYCGYRVQSDRQVVRPFVWVTFDPNNTVTEG